MSIEIPSTVRIFCLSIDGIIIQDFWCLFYFYMVNSLYVPCAYNILSNFLFIWNHFWTYFLVVRKLRKETFLLHTFVEFLESDKRILLAWLCSIHRLAADWPKQMQVCRLITQDHMNSKYASYGVPFHSMRANLTFNLAVFPDWLRFLLAVQKLSWKSWTTYFQNNGTTRTTRVFGSIGREQAGIYVI